MLPTFADENIKGAIIKGLRRWSMDIVTVHDRGLAGHDDEEKFFPWRPLKVGFFLPMIRTFWRSMQPGSVKARNTRASFTGTPIV